MRTGSPETEARELLRRLALPAKPGESVKAAIGRAARYAGLSYARAEKIWYAKDRVVRAEEMDALRTAARTRGQSQETRGRSRATSETREAKLFRNNRSQAVRIPAEFELPGDRVLISRDGDRLIIEPTP